MLSIIKSEIEQNRLKIFSN